MESMDELPPVSALDLFRNLQERADSLLGEFRSFQAHLKSCKKQQEVEVRAFKRGVESEVKTLGKLQPAFVSSANGSDQDDEPRVEDSGENPHVHALRSSNLPFYEAVWQVAKCSSSICALSKRMYLGGQYREPKTSPGSTTTTVETADRRDAPKKSVIVDLVTSNGLEWVKVSTLTEKRLLFEMAKEGWERYGDVSDEDDTFEGREDDGDHELATPKDDAAGDKLELVRLAEALKSAAREARVQYRHPHIRFVLPKIREGVIDDVDSFLADLRSTGATVQCSDELSQIFQDTQLNLEKMMPTTTVSPLTRDINVDCTILLALISDISHFSREHLLSDPASQAHTFHRAIMNQIDLEESVSMLSDEIYPLLAGRHLECTRQAAQRMREIVEIMATSSERTRAEILLGEGTYSVTSAQALRQAFDEHSRHRVPIDLKLPVKVVDVCVEELLGSKAETQRDAGNYTPFPSSVAARVSSSLHLTPINASVFLYGWHHQIITLTSNQHVASSLDRAINEVLDADERQSLTAREPEFVGPLVYVCDTARSLIGKAKFK